MVKKIKLDAQQLDNDGTTFISKSFFNVLPVDDEIESDEEVDSEDEEPKRKKSNNKVETEAETNGKLSREELKARLHKKIAELRKDKVENVNSEKSMKRKKRKEKKKAELQAKKKNFTSQANPNLVNQNQAKKSSTKNPTLPNTSDTSSLSVKTPLQKKPVKKTNGEIVYSKFDFISDGRKSLDFMQNKPLSDSKPEEILKSVEKHQGKVQKLQSQGKVSAAVIAVDKQKWNNALQRAKGTKVRDDPALLKKTIKKQDKIKQVKQKKWKERVDHQEKQKEQRQTKRQTNIQARKDDKKARAKKLLRKKGRII